MKLIDILFPPICPGCGALTEQSGLCVACASLLAGEMAQICRGCGQVQTKCTCRILPASEMAAPRTPACGLAQRHLVSYRKGKRALSARMLWQAKERHLSVHEAIWGEAFAPLLRPLLTENGRPLLTYIPRAAYKVRQTGTDQARMLALGIGKACGLRPLPLLVRHGRGEQKKKGARERISESMGQYTLRETYKHMIKGRRIWLCDDVITTGASMLRCADCLLSAGASEVLALAIAKTQSPLQTEQEEKNEEENRS